MFLTYCMISRSLHKTDFNFFQVWLLNIFFVIIRALMLMSKKDTNVMENVRKYFCSCTGKYKGYTTGAAVLKCKLLKCLELPHLLLFFNYKNSYTRIPAKLIFEYICWKCDSSDNDGFPSVWGPLWKRNFAALTSCFGVSYSWYLSSTVSHWYKKFSTFCCL